MTIEQARLAAAILSGGTSSAAIYEAVLEAAREAMPQPRTILDFGSGCGQLLPLLSQRYPAAELHAADIMEQPDDLLPGVVWHCGDLNGDSGIAASSIDLLFAVEVIEHLENPRQIIREIARVLAPGGVAIMSTPNTGSYRSLITLTFRGHHAQFDDSNYPAHITPVGEVDFARIGQEAGLVLERFFYTDHGTVPKMLNHRWQAIPALGKRLRGKRFSDNFGAVLRKSAAPESMR